MEKKIALLNHALILSDLERFTCRCKGGYCMGIHDAAMVGQIRAHVVKLGSQTAVILSIFFTHFDVYLILHFLSPRPTSKQ